MFEPKHNPGEVLHGEFDFDVHNETFADYCEVVITRDGDILYGVPSHVECLKRLYARRFGRSADDDCPPEFYSDYAGWLCDQLEACLVYTRFFGKFYNDTQRFKLRQLQMRGCCNFAPPFKRLLVGDAKTAALMDGGVVS